MTDHTIRTLLDTTPKQISTGVDAMRPLKGCYYNHVPELGDDGWEWRLNGIHKDAIPAIEWHAFYYVPHDGRRYHELAGVKFEGEWVMVTQNAGREGDDHARRFVIDRDRLAAMINAIRAATAPEAEVVAGVVDIDQPIPELFTFYGSEDIRHMTPYDHL